MKDSPSRRDANLAIKLMLLFFGVELLSRSLVAFGVTQTPIANGLARDAFLQIFGILLILFKTSVAPAAPFEPPK